MEYAVRGPLVIRASEIEKELEQVCVRADRAERIRLFDVQRPPRLGLGICQTEP